LMTEPGPSDSPFFEEDGDSRDDRQSLEGSDEEPPVLVMDEPGPSDSTHFEDVGNGRDDRRSLMRADEEPPVLVMDGPGPSDSPLFEDDWNCRDNQRGLVAIGSSIITMGVLTGTIFGFWTRGAGGALCYLLIIFIVSTGLGAFILSQWGMYRPFRIMEDGISFTKPSSQPFLPFDQIDFIITADNEIVHVYTMAFDDHPITIASTERNMPADPDIRYFERIGDWPRFYETFKACLTMAQPETRESYLIREYDEVEWTAEALDALDNRLGWGLEASNIARRINEEVLKQDRRLVELADIQGYLK